MPGSQGEPLSKNPLAQDGGALRECSFCENGKRPGGLGVQLSGRVCLHGIQEALGSIPSTS